MSKTTQVENNIRRIKLYQDIENLFKQYNQNYLIELFKTLGEYIQIKSREKEEDEKNKIELEYIKKSYTFFNKCSNFTERDLNDMKLYGISIILSGLEYNEIFRKLFYDWLKILNQVRDT